MSTIPNLLQRRAKLFCDKAWQLDITNDVIIQCCMSISHKVTINFNMLHLLIKIYYWQCTSLPCYHDALPLVCCERHCLMKMRLNPHDFISSNMDHSFVVCFRIGPSNDTLLLTRLCHQITSSRGTISTNKAPIKISSAIGIKIFHNIQMRRANNTTLYHEHTWDTTRHDM